MGERVLVIGSDGVPAAADDRVCARPYTYGDADATIGRARELVKRGLVV